MTSDEGLRHLRTAASRYAHILGRALRLGGIDYVSIERYGPERYEVHETLLASGVVILEGLDLRQVPPGEYFLVCAPLNVVGAEGAPARVFLIDGAP